MFLYTFKRIWDMVDYKSTGDIFRTFSNACPKGINAFFDNVSGQILNAAVDNMKRLIHPMWLPV